MIITPLRQYVYVIYCYDKEVLKMGKVKFTTTISQTIIDKLKIQAIKEHRSVSSILEELILKYLNENN